MKTYVICSSAANFALPRTSMVFPVRLMAGVAFLVLTALSGMCGSPQQYLFNTPISAWQQFPFSDVNHPRWPGPPMYFGGSRTTYFEKLSGSVTYDSEADTMRLTGSVFLDNSSGTIGFKVYETNTVSVDFNINNGEIPFDSGLMSGSLAGFNLQIPVTGGWHLNTGDVDYAGEFEFQYNLALDVFRKSNDADQFSFDLFSSRGGLFGGVTLTNFTAENGFRLILQNTHPADGVAYVHWDEHILAVVPEPGGASLFLLAFLHVFARSIFRE